MITLLTAFALYQFDADWGWWVAFTLVALVDFWLIAVESRA